MTKDNNEAFREFINYLWRLILANIIDILLIEIAKN